MDKLLKSLFDYQRFEQQPELQKVIDSVHARYSMRELNLDELEYVAAAAPREYSPDKKNQERK